MTQIEGNKAIAEFMGLRRDEFPDKSNWWYVDLENDEFIYHNKSESLFHTSWDWLMPVVEKIEGYDLATIQIGIGNYCTISGIGDYIKETHSGNSKIEAVWLAVVDFLLTGIKPIQKHPNERR